MVRNLKGSGHWGDLHTDGRLTLGWILVCDTAETASRPQITMEAWVVNEGFVMWKVALGQGILQALRFSHANYRFINVRYSFIVRGGKIGPPEVAVRKD